MSDYDQLEFRHLKYIQAVAEEGTITAASNRVLTLPSECVSHKRSGFGPLSGCSCTFALGCEGGFSGVGLLLELRRAEVVQSRVHP